MLSNGEKIRQARKSAGLTQRDMFDWLDIPIRTIQDWEYGINKPSDWATNLILDKIERESDSYKSDTKRIYHH